VTTIENSAKTVLENSAAINLWSNGKDTWNAWVKDNPKADVSFYGIHFPTQPKNESINFDKFQFPDGEVNFSGATFSNGDVDFGGAIFGDGHVYFSGAKFGDGDVNFSGVTFGDGNVSFHRATFGEGDVYFSGAKFGDGDVNFSGATFSNGHVDFTRAIFGDGHVIFESAFFGGQLSIQGCDKTDSIQSFSFKNCQFKNAVILEDLDLSCVLDLTNTSLQNQISLEGLACKLKRKRGGTWSEIANVACDKNDIARFRRLKEVCENNKDHELALVFHANEMRAKRWHKTRWLASWADMAYSLLSDYGQSVSRPLMSLFITWFIFAGAYASIAKNFLWDSCYQWLQMIGFSIVHSMPLLPIGRSVRKAAFEVYFVDFQSYVFVFMTVQSLVSLLLIFLVGLGLRNRFRI
jgi:uncharacterized protein YjbI with pentapeptide repeats